MGNFLLEMFGSSGDLSTRTILIRLAAATIVAFFIYICYRFSHVGSTPYSRRFNVSLIAVTLVVTTTVIVIGSNIALAIIMAGALAVAMAHMDTRGAIFALWAVMAGICCGVGNCLVAAIGSVFIFVILILLGLIRNDERILMILRTTRANEERAEALIFQFFERRAILRSKNTTKDNVEFTWEIGKRYMDRQQRRHPDDDLDDAVYELGNVEYFRIVMKGDDAGE